MKKSSIIAVFIILTTIILVTTLLLQTDGTVSDFRMADPVIAPLCKTLTFRCISTKIGCPREQPYCNGRSCSENGKTCTGIWTCVPGENKDLIRCEDTDGGTICMYHSDQRAYCTLPKNNQGKKN